MDDASVACRLAVAQYDVGEVAAVVGDELATAERDDYGAGQEAVQQKKFVQS